MFLFNRARGSGLRMLELGFGAEDRSFEDSDKENEPESHHHPLHGSRNKE